MVMMKQVSNMSYVGDTGRCERRSKVERKAAGLGEAEPTQPRAALRQCSVSSGAVSCCQLAARAGIHAAVI